MTSRLARRSGAARAQRGLRKRSPGFQPRAGARRETTLPIYPWPWLDEERARFYGDLVLTSLNDAARRALEAMMKGYEYQSDFAKKYVAQGEAKGRNEGRTEGRNEGRTEEAARNLLTVLRVRGIAVPDPARERILGQRDPERLERWLEKAIVAASLAEVIDDPS